MSCTTQLSGRTCEKKTKYAPLHLCSDISDFILIQQGRSNELDVQNEWEKKNTHTHSGHWSASLLVLRACVNDVRKIIIGKSKIKNKRLISKKTLRAMSTENTRTDCPELFTPLVWETSCGVGKILENSKGTPHITTTTAVLMTSP